MALPWQLAHPSVARQSGTSRLSSSVNPPNFQKQNACLTNPPRQLSWNHNVQVQQKMLLKLAHVHSKQLLSTFLSQRIFCLHIIKWSAAKWAVEQRFSFSSIAKCSKQKPIKNRGRTTRQGENFPREPRKKPTNERAPLASAAGRRDTSAAEGSSRMAAALPPPLGGISCSSPVHQTAPVKDLTHPPFCPFTPAPGWKREQHQSSC